MENEKLINWNIFYLLDGLVPQIGGDVEYSILNLKKLLKSGRFEDLIKILDNKDLSHKIFRNTGYIGNPSHAVGVFYDPETNKDLSLLYIFNLGDNATGIKKKFDDKEFINAIVYFEIPKDKKWDGLIEDLLFGSIYENKYLEILTKLKVYQKKYNLKNQKFQILEREIIINENNLFMKQQITGTCSFHGTFVFLIWYFLTNYSLNELENLLVENLEWNISMILNNREPINKLNSNLALIIKYNSLKNNIPSKSIFDFEKLRHKFLSILEKFNDTKKYNFSLNPKNIIDNFSLTYQELPNFLYYKKDDEKSYLKFFKIFNSEINNTFSQEKLIELTEPFLDPKSTEKIGDFFFYTTYFIFTENFSNSFNYFYQNERLRLYFLLKSLLVHRQMKELFILSDNSKKDFREFYVTCCNKDFGDSSLIQFEYLRNYFLIASFNILYNKTHKFFWKNLDFSFLKDAILKLDTGIEKIEFDFDSGDFYLRGHKQIIKNNIFEDEISLKKFLRLINSFNYETNKEKLILKNQVVGFILYNFMKLYHYQEMKDFEKNLYFKFLVDEKIKNIFNFDLINKTKESFEINNNKYLDNSPTFQNNLVSNQFFDENYFYVSNNDFGKKYIYQKNKKNIEELHGLKDLNNLTENIYYEKTNKSYIIYINYSKNILYSKEFFTKEKPEIIELKIENLNSKLNKLAFILNLERFVKIENYYYFYSKNYQILIKYNLETDKIIINEEYILENKPEKNFMNNLFSYYYNIFVTENKEYLFLPINYNSKYKNLIFENKKFIFPSFNSFSLDKIFILRFNDSFTQILNNNTEELLSVLISSSLIGDPFLLSLVTKKILNLDLTIEINDILQNKYSNLNKYNFLGSYLGVVLKYYFTGDISILEFMKENNLGLEISWNEEKEIDLENIKYDYKNINNFWSFITSRILIENLKYEDKKDDELEKYIKSNINCFRIIRYSDFDEDLTFLLNQMNKVFHDIKNYIISNFFIYYWENKSFITFFNENKDEIIRFNELNHLLKLYPKLLNSIDTKDLCFKLKDIVNYIEPNNLNLYYNKNLIEHLFEFLFGFIIQKDQKVLLDNILENPRIIRQLLMGRGKTSVITPLIILNNLLNPKHKIKTMLILPQHLMSQSEEIVKNLLLVNFKFEILRYKKDNDKLNNIYDEKTIRTVKIVDSEMIKNHLLINFEENKNLKDYYLICDEIDFQIDYKKSEFNMVIGKKKEISKKILENYFILLKDLYNKFTDFIETNKILIENLTIKIIEAKINEFLNIKKDILDLTHLDLKLILSKIDLIYENTDIELNFYKMNLFYLINSFKLIHNKEYGRSKKYKITVVPYSQVNTPLDDSNFSNIYLFINLTLLTYLNSGLLFLDIENTVKKFIFKQNISLKFLPLDIQKKLNIFEKFIPLTRLNDKSLKINLKDKELIDLFVKKFVLNELDYYVYQKTVSFLNIISPYYSSLKCGFSGSINFSLPDYSSFITNIKDTFEVLPKKDNYSISSIKSAILGSILPTEIIKLDEEDYLIKSIKKEKLKKKGKKKDSKKRAPKSEKVYYFENKIENNLLKMMKQENFNVLIDSAAYLKNYSAEYISEVLWNFYKGEKNVFYISNNGNKKFIEADTKLIKPMKDFNNTEEFIGIFTQDKIVGIDIKLPYNTKFLCTINNQSNLTEVSQAIFRARRLNISHYLGFVYYSDFFKEEEILSNDKIYKILEINERKIFLENNNSKLNQFIKDIKLWEERIIEYPIFIEKVNESKESLLKNNEMFYRKIYHYEKINYLIDEFIESLRKKINISIEITTEFDIEKETEVSIDIDKKMKKDIDLSVIERRYTDDLFEITRNDYFENDIKFYSKKKNIIVENINSYILKLSEILKKHNIYLSNKLYDEFLYLFKNENYNKMKIFFLKINDNPKISFLTFEQGLSIYTYLTKRTQIDLFSNDFKIFLDTNKVKLYNYQGVNVLDSKDILDNKKPILLYEYFTKIEKYDFINLILIIKEFGFDDSKIIFDFNNGNNNFKINLLTDLSLPSERSKLLETLIHSILTRDQLIKLLKMYNFKLEEQNIILDLTKDIFTSDIKYLHKYLKYKKKYNILKKLSYGKS